MWQNQSQHSSFRESIKALEADVQHANTLAAALPRDLDGDCVQMKVSYGFLAPFLLFLIEWMDYSCLDTLPSCLGLLHILVYKVYVDRMPTMTPQERKATIREFYAIIYPSLKQLDSNLVELMKENHKVTQLSNTSNGGGVEEKRQSCNSIQEEEECGICMETGSKVVLPNCSHSMCVGCFHDWYIRSQSCPFCRGSLTRVNSRDLWVLTSNCDVVDSTVLAQDNLRCFYLYIDKLPLAVPDSTNVMLYDYMI
ncbi:E3 ubiquitin-protein ligase AIRP2-like isoform X2 [Lycium barbarum]|uniref:E3 ubiquitin-protein ligase AIRP2-like isoform X2 n=1 Tax=Lycium barbarum TaxID=112863 RepID=UPI00293F6B39|nr:E3 ubiquitin-protein ligase AIRP2-like isoform X2 [Lycium barbarum]